MASISVIIKQKKTRLARRRKHIHKVVQGTEDKPRLVVFRSNRHIYAQLVDDFNHSTITGCSTMTPEIRDAVKGKPKIEQAKAVGEFVAKQAKEKGIARVCFDRNGRLYHGRVKAVADGARASGLII